MANEVYLLTHDGLSQMVSARAATRFLDKALEAKGYSSDSVSSEDMREILQGPILRELRQILPKDGVERSIKQISRNLRKQAEKVAESLLAVANAPASGASNLGLNSSNLLGSNLPSVSGDVLLTGEDEASTEQVLGYAAAEADLGIVSHTSPIKDKQAFDTGEVEVALEQALERTTVTSQIVEVAPIALASINPALINPALINPAPETIPASVAQASPVAQVKPAVQVKTKSPQTEYSPEDLAKMLVKFAQLENIKVVAAVKANGEISMSRGSGFDVDALSRLGSLGIKLLSRARAIRSYYLSQSRYQLFMFPLANQTLIIVGSSEVNVGDVFSVRSHLEEDL
jgi:hypothetical protein